MASKLLTISAALIAALAVALVLLRDNIHLRSFPLFHVAKGSEVFDPARDIPSLSGQVAIITGGNTGLGYGSALELAKKDCHVILACRSKARGEEAAAKIRALTGNGKVEFMALDLSSVANTQSFVQKFAERDLPLHILMLNAGIMGVPFTISEDGVEMHMQVNHLSHFVLSYGLLPFVRRSQPSRLVVISSNMYLHSYAQGINLQRLNDEEQYMITKAYGQSKLANVLFMQDLARRLEQAGDKEVFANAAHPGAVVSEITRHQKSIIASYLGQWAGDLYIYIVESIIFSLEQGVLTQLYLAASPEVAEKKITGRFFVPLAEELPVEGYALNDTLERELFEWSLGFLPQEYRKNVPAI